MGPSVQYVQTYLNQLQAVIAKMPAEAVDQVITILLDSAKRGSKVFICGNGGSASTASHFACDLAKNTMVSGAPRLRAMALTDNIALMTAWANDTAYDNVFAAQLAPLVEVDDVVIGISCSGNSGNVLKAMTVAGEQGATTIGFTGDQGGQLKELVDLCIQVPSPYIEQQEDIHLIMEHVICSAIREQLRQEYASAPSNSTAASMPTGVVT